MTKQELMFKLWDKLISHSVWAWFVASIFLLFNLITNEHWYVITMILMGGRVAEGVVSSPNFGRRQTPPVEAPSVEEPSEPVSESEPC